MNLTPRWDTYFMALCDFVAQQSKDFSTRLGCVIVGPNRSVLSTGYNGMPRGVSDDVPERQERPLKYAFFEHAERNALYNALYNGTTVKGGTLYCQWLPCADCARGIIQAGIVAVVVADMNMPDRWIESVDMGLTMMREAGIVVRVAAVVNK